MKDDHELGVEELSGMHGDVSVAAIAAPAAPAQLQSSLVTIASPSKVPPAPGWYTKVVPLLALTYMLIAEFSG
jgi:hypothetical protein